MGITNIYWGLVSHGDWNLHIAATDKGVCYMSSNNSPVTDVAYWARRSVSSHQLINSPEKIQVYADQLISYLKGELTKFSFTVHFYGTDFQQAVWNELMRIPYGARVHYSDIADAIGNPTAVRAVGTAIGSNPVTIFVPCHRVVPSNGKLGGYRGGPDMKLSLLRLEHNNKNSQAVT